MYAKDILEILCVDHTRGKVKCDNIIIFPLYFFPVGKSTSGEQVENHSHCPGTEGGDSTIIILRWKGDNMF